MSLGKKIMELRKKNNYTQNYLSSKLGVSRQTFSNWENDITSPDLVQAINLAKIFNINLDEFCDNNIEIDCKNNKIKNILTNLVEKKCNLIFVDDFFDFDIDFDTLVKVLNVNDDFIKIQYNKNHKTCIKMIDIDLIQNIKVIVGDD